MDWQPIEILRPTPRSTLTFNNIDDVEAFVAKEVEFWVVCVKLVRWTNNLREFIARWRNEAESRQSLRNAIENILRQRFAGERFLSSLDPEAAAIAELGRSAPDAAGAALAVVHGVPILSDHNFLSYKDNVYGSAKGVSILAGTDAFIASAAAEQLRRSLTDFEGQVSVLRSLSLSLRSDEIAAADAREHAAEKQLERQDASFSGAEQSRQVIFEKLKSDLEALTSAYETKMQLRGPVRYWESKGKRHHRAKWMVGVALVIYSVASLAYLHWAFDQAAAHLPTQAGDPISYAALFKAGAFALVLTSVAFWVGRVLLRVFLSNQHLATDADERMTMTMTFLALIRSKSIKDEERR